MLISLELNLLLIAVTAITSFSLIPPKPNLLNLWPQSTQKPTGFIAFNTSILTPAYSFCAKRFPNFSGSSLPIFISSLFVFLPFTSVEAFSAFACTISSLASFVLDNNADTPLSFTASSAKAVSKAWACFESILLNQLPASFVPLLRIIFFNFAKSLGFTGGSVVSAPPINVPAASLRIIVPTPSVPLAP